MGGGGGKGKTLGDKGLRGKGGKGGKGSQPGKREKILARRKKREKISGGERPYGERGKGKGGKALRKKIWGQKALEWERGERISTGKAGKDLGEGKGRRSQGGKASGGKGGKGSQQGKGEGKGQDLRGERP